MKPMFYVVMDRRREKAQDTEINEIIVIVFYLIVPLFWAVLLDVYIKFPVFSLLYILLWILLLMATGKRFPLFCDRLFFASQRFLLWFRKIGWNYVVSSVIICVVVPVMITVVLVVLNVKG